MRNLSAIAPVVLVLLLAGCSSPPPPPPVEWDKPAAPMNGTLPQWSDNNVTVTAPAVTGRWSTVLYAFNGSETVYTPEVYYAVAHSPRIVVATPGGASFFTAKNWLRKHGAKGVIQYQPKIHCLTCNETDVYLAR